MLTSATSGMADLFEEHADQVADDFYDNLTDYEETVEVIGRSEKGLEALKQTQKAYLVEGVIERVAHQRAG